MTFVDPNAVLMKEMRRPWQSADGSFSLTPKGNGLLLSTPFGSTELLEAVSFLDCVSAFFQSPYAPVFYEGEKCRLFRVRPGGMMAFVPGAADAATFGNTTIKALWYDGEKMHLVYIDESGAEFSIPLNQVPSAKPAVCSCGYTGAISRFCPNCGARLSEF